MKTRPSQFLLISILILGLATVYSCGGGGGGGGSSGGPTAITALGAGESHAGFVKGGTIWLWGSNGSSQTGTDTPGLRNILIPTQMATDSGWRSLSMGSTHSLGVKENGTLWAWGSNGSGQLGTALFIPGQINYPSQIGTETAWNQTSAGEGYSAGLKTDGTLWAWGSNSSGQLGTNTGINYLDYLSQVGTDVNWDTVAAGVRHVLALKNDGTIWAWGYNAEAQCGTDTGGANITAPVQVGNSTSWMSIAPGDFHSLALKTDGSLWAWGKNDSGILGTTTFGPFFTSPIRIGTDSDWAEISAGYTHSLALKLDGTLWAWGSNDFGQLGTDVSVSEIKTPTQVGTDLDWTHIASGDEYSVAVKDDGTVWSWGYNQYGQLGNGVMGNKNNQAFVSTMLPSVWSSVVPPAAGGAHTLALKADGTLWAWGLNGNGQVGTSSQLAWKEPVQVGTDTDWSSVYGGLDNSFAIKTDNTLWAWGKNTSGKLGTTGGPSSTPFQVGTDIDWNKVSPGYDHTLALKTGGTLWAWGDNTYGQLGTTGTSIMTPAQIGTATNWTSIAAGQEHSVGLRLDGTLWGWGRNNYGQAGTDFSVTAVATPSQIGTAADWNFVASGANHSIAIKSTDNTAWAWGQGNSGQLGSGWTNQGTPIPVNTSQAFDFVCGGSLHTLAIENSSGFRWLFGWGGNYQGQLGNGYGSGRTNLPNTINTLFKRKYVACGQSFSIAFNINDGSLGVWGENRYGQLGDGTAWVTTPQQIY